MGDKIMICDCSSVEHQVIFRLGDSDSEYRTVYMYVLLIRQGFFRRLKNGIRYIFGYRCRYSHFDEIIVTKENYRPLKETVEFIEGLD